jgi:hypothetical protein
MYSISSKPGMRYESPKYKKKVWNLRLPIVSKGKFLYRGWGGGVRAFKG